MPTVETAQPISSGLKSLNFEQCQAAIIKMFYAILRSERGYEHTVIAYRENMEKAHLDEVRNLASAQRSPVAVIVNIAGTVFSSLGPVAITPLASHLFTLPQGTTEWLDGGSKLIGGLTSNGSRLFENWNKGSQTQFEAASQGFSRGLDDANRKFEGTEAQAKDLLDLIRQIHQKDAETKREIKR